MDGCALDVAFLGRIRTCDPLVPNHGGSRCPLVVRGPRRASIGAPPRCNMYVVCYAYIQDSRLRDLTGASERTAA
jgi:hypothetical protein